MEERVSASSSASCSSPAALEAMASSARGGAMSSECDDASNHNNNARNPYRRVKFLCSFGGRILPRPVDGTLRYVGGETRIVSLSRDIGFSEFMSKLAEVCCEEGFAVKYQLPEEEDLDSLVSVLCDDDLTNMVEEYDKLEATDGFTRLRVFLFLSSENVNVGDPSIVCSDANGDQRYVNALNGVAVSMSRSGSTNSLSTLVENVGSGALQKVTPQIVLPNSPRQSHHHVSHLRQPPAVQSPPVSPHPMSPLGHVVHPTSLQFDDADLRQHQHQHQEPQPQQCWTLGSHYNIPDFSSGPLGSAVSTYHESAKATNYIHPIQSEVLHSVEHSRALFNHKQYLKVFPANDNYVGNSAEYNSSGGFQSRTESANQWYEESPRHVYDTLSCHEPPFVHQSSQQQNCYAMSAGYHMTETPRISDYGSPRLSHGANVAYPFLHNRRTEHMQPTELQHPLRHNDIEAQWHTSLHNQFEHPQQNSGQHVPTHDENESHWRMSTTFHECYEATNQEYVSPRTLQGKLVRQSSVLCCGICEEAGRNEPQYQVIDHNHCWNKGNQKHIQEGCCQSCGIHEPIERQAGYNNVQLGDHIDLRNSYNSFRKYSHQTSGAKYCVQHCRHAVQMDEHLLANEREGVSQGMFEANPSYEWHYDGQISSEINISSRFVEQISSSQDTVHPRWMEAQVHHPSYIPAEDVRVPMESMNEEQIGPSMNKAGTEFAYEDRIGRARDWVMHSRNVCCDTFDQGFPSIQTKSESGRNISLNYRAEQSSRCSRGLNTHAFCSDFPPTLDKYETVYQVEPSTNNMQIEEKLMANCCTARAHGRSVADQNMEVVASTEQKAEEATMVYSIESTRDAHNMPYYVSDEVSLKDTADVSRDKEIKVSQKGLHVGMDLDNVLGLKGMNPVTILTTDKQVSQANAFKTHELNKLHSIESKDAKSNPLSPALPDGLTPPCPEEVLSSLLSSSVIENKDAHSHGPPIYDKSPEHSINFTGQADIILQTGKGKQVGQSGNLEIEDSASKQLTMKTNECTKATLSIPSCDRLLEYSLENESEVLGCPENATDLRSEKHISNSALLCMINLDGNEAASANKIVEDYTLFKESSITFMHGIDVSEEKGTAEVCEKPLGPDEAIEKITKSFGNANLSPETQALAQGLQIIKNDDLEDVRELGSGTYGTVYYGRWKGSDVAIKRIKSSCFTGDRAEQERLMADFWREACILSNLHHPNVVAFYGIVLDGPDGTMATVTEYMVNGSLKQVLNKKDRTIDRKKRIILAREAAFGMEYLHVKNIVHFDLKCDNLLVNMKDPQRPICKIGDLGLSKIKQRTLVSGGIRGTLPWMAPELLSGKSGMVTEKVDVYSFGIVMWELLTGEEPYAKMHCGEIIGGILNNTLRPPIPHWCEPSWRSLMEHCWSPDPGERPIFSEIAAELRAMGEANNLK